MRKIELGDIEKAIDEDNVIENELTFTLEDLLRKVAQKKDNGLYQLLSELIRLTTEATINCNKAEEKYLDFLKEATVISSQTGTLYDYIIDGSFKKLFESIEVVLEALKNVLIEQKESKEQNCELIRMVTQHSQDLGALKDLIYMGIINDRESLVNLLKPAGVQVSKTNIEGDVISETNSKLKIEGIKNEKF